jgi:hypothetical protein
VGLEKRRRKNGHQSDSRVGLEEEKTEGRRRDVGQGLVGKQVFSHLDSYQEKTVRDIVQQYEKEGVVRENQRPT